MENSLYIFLTVPKQISCEPVSVWNQRWIAQQNITYYFYCMTKWYTKMYDEMVNWICTTKWYNENVRRNGTLNMYDEMVHWKCSTDGTLKMYDEMVHWKCTTKWYTENV